MRHHFVVETHSNTIESLRSLNRIERYMLLIPFFLASCGGTGKYVCPDPIGTIVRDDCDAYRIRYESLKTKISAGYQGIGASIDVGEQSLRDPSELIQLMAARMTALCHDFNSCRLTPADYMKKREELDKTVTMLFALADQLGNKDLSQEERSRAFNSLLQLLEGRERKQESTPPNHGHDNQRATKKYTGRVGSSMPWFGSKFAPPLPPEPEPGYPRLVSPWGKPYLKNVLERVDRDFKDKYGGTWHRYNEVVGYRPRVPVYLFGEFAADDMLGLSFSGKWRTSCPVGKNKKGVVRVSCPPPDDLVLKRNEFQVEVRFKKAGEHLPVLLGTLSYRVFRVEERQAVGDPIYTYQLDSGGDVEQGWLYFFPEKGLLPPDFERPHIRITLQLRNIRPKVTARCFVDGDPVTPSLRPGRHSGRTGAIQDQPRYIKTGPNSSQSNPGAFLVWQHYDFTLPFYVARQESKPQDKDLSPWPPRPGNWTCKIKADGTLVRELHFTIQDNGSPVPLPEQDGGAGDITNPWWKVQLDMVPNNIEAQRGGGSAMLLPHGPDVAAEGTGEQS